MKSSKFDEFFAQHSKNVDNANKLGFWELTDSILEHYLLENMPKRNKVQIVDFGGGTGRWLKRLDKYFKDSIFIIVDLSADMLAQAKLKIKNREYKNTIKLIQGDIANVEALKDSTTDYIISTYNPLSFVDEPQRVIREAYRVLKKDGTVMITVQGYYNAIYSKLNNFIANEKELMAIYNDKKVVWTNDVPSLWQLSKEDMESMFKEAGFSAISSRGIACVIQPQNEDFDPKNVLLGSISKKLNENEAYFNTLLDLEIEIGSRQEVVNRAMNILTIGRKS